MDSKKIVSVSRSIDSKGEAKPGEKAKGTKDENQGTNQDRDQYSHYMCQTKHITQHVSNYMRMCQTASVRDTRSAKQLPEVRLHH